MKESSIHNALLIKYIWSLLGVLFSLSAYSYDNIKNSEWEYQVFEKDHKKGLLDNKSKIVIPAEYDDLGWSDGPLVVAEGVIGYKENGLWGLVNLKNERVIRPNYTTLTHFKDNWVIAAKEVKDASPDTYGIINTRGNTVLAFEYAYLGPFHYNLIAAKYNNGKTSYGIIDEQGQQIVPYQYRDITPLSTSLAKIDMDGKLGLIGPSGRVVTPNKYEKFRANDTGGWEGKPLTNFQIRDSKNNILRELEAEDLQVVDKNLYAISKGKHWTIQNLKGSEIKAYYNFKTGPFIKGYSQITWKNKVGLIDKTGQMILLPVYDSIKVDKTHFIVLKEEKWKVLDVSGKTISQRQYDGIHNMVGGLFPVQRQGDWGLMDMAGVEKIAPQYQKIGAFNNGLAIAKYFGSEGIIDTKGNWRVKPRYEKLKILDAQHFMFRDRGKSGLINGYGQEIYSTTHFLMETETAFLQVSEVGKKGLVTWDGRVLLPVAYEELTPIENHPDMFTYQDSLGVNIIGLDGQLHLQLKLQDVVGYGEDFFGIKTEDQYGFIDRNGKLRIANRYNDIGLYSEGKAAVKIRNNWGYIDKIERIRVQPVYEEVRAFKNGIAMVKKMGKWGLINEFGKVVLPLKHDNIIRTDKGKFICESAGKKGLVNTSGELEIYPKYHSIKDLKNGYILVSRDNKYGLLTQEGESTIPMIYDHITYDATNEVYITHQKVEWENL